MHEIIDTWKQMLTSKEFIATNRNLWQEWIRTKKISMELKEHEFVCLFFIHTNILRSLFRTLDFFLTATIILLGNKNQSYSSISVKLSWERPQPSPMTNMF